MLHDVAVVGAGPAGAWAAFLLARARCAGACCSIRRIRVRSRAAAGSPDARWPSSSPALPPLPGGRPSAAPVSSMPVDGHARRPSICLGSGSTDALVVTGRAAFDGLLLQRRAARREPSSSPRARLTSAAPPADSRSTQPTGELMPRRSSLAPTARTASCAAGWRAPSRAASCRSRPAFSSTAPRATRSCSSSSPIRPATSGRSRVLIIWRSESARQPTAGVTSAALRARAQPVGSIARHRSAVDAPRTVLVADSVLERPTTWTGWRSSRTRMVPRRRRSRRGRPDHARRHFLRPAVRVVRGGRHRRLERRRRTPVRRADADGSHRANSAAPRA